MSRPVGVPYPSMGKGQGRGASTDGSEQVRTAPNAISSAKAVEAPHPQPFPIEGKGDELVLRGRGDFERKRHAPQTLKRAKRLHHNMTFWESKLWTELRKQKLPIRRQAPIGRFVVDFACHSARLVIEIDGAIHENLPEVAVRDMERQAWLESQGYRVLRFTNNEVAADLPGIAERICTAVRNPAQ